MTDKMKEKIETMTENEINKMTEKEKEEIVKYLDENPLELVNVYPKDVEEFLMGNYPELTEWTHGKKRSMYDLKRKNGQGCYFSVKVPDSVHETGKGIHINTRYVKGNKDYQVYPSEKRGQKLGQGTFASKSIHRDKQWRQNLSLEAITGEQLCKVLYEGKRFYNDTEKSFIYKLFDQRIETRKALSKKHAHCNKLERESSKEECQKEEKGIEIEFNELNQKISKLLK